MVDTIVTVGACLLEEAKKKEKKGWLECLEKDHYRCHDKQSTIDWSRRLSARKTHKTLRAGLD